LIGAYAPHDGRFALHIPGVHAIRASRPYTELVHTVWQPGLCIVAQGAKRVMLGQHVYEYDESRMLVSKVLRLQEARRLMLSVMMDVSAAGLRVGYLSVSQFSREYRRFFGSSPTKDVARLREHLGSGGARFPV
jgi:hypothetical protein